MFRPLLALLAIFILLMAPSAGFAQSLLDKPVNIDVNNRRVEDVLDIIGKRSGCSFSYNSPIIPRDSLVNLSFTATPVRSLLHHLFADRYQYKELNNHIVILPAETEKWFTITGYITDAITGEKINDVSIIARQQLSSTLSDRDGYFRLRVKDKGKFALADITFSKGTFYADTTLHLFPGYDQEISVSLAPNAYNMPEVMVTQYGMEHSWFGKFLISSKLRQQSANLGKFFVSKPVQASFIPGIGTHGKLSSQVTNKLSLNVLGGYTAGVNGIELGGIFNINKKDVRWVQVGGIFNIVSGSVKGMQAAGIFNNVSNSVRGFEVGGIGNIVGDSITGVQVGGIFNRSGGHVMGAQIAGVVNLLDKKDTTGSATADTFYEIRGAQIAGFANVVNNDVHGAQVAGFVNLVNKDVRGFQCAGFANVARRSMKGVQLSSIINITGRLEGTQIALINIADTVNGYSIGFINIVKKGYHALSCYTTDLTDVSIAYKTGTKRLYSILSAGARFNSGKTDFLYGFGIGTEKKLSRHIGLSAEFHVANLYKHNIDANVLLIRMEPTFNWNITRRFTLFTGPALCFVPYIFYAQDAGTTGFELTNMALHNLHTDYNTASWVGWQLGLHIL